MQEKNYKLPWLNFHTTVQWTLILLGEKINIQMIQKKIALVNTNYCNYTMPIFIFIPKPTLFIIM